MKKIITIIWARPQFIKHAPVDKIIKKYANNITIHTGQHFDENMSDIFFTQLEIDKPDYNLKINWSTHWKMTWEMMIEIEEIVLKEKPDFIVVYGDTNSTLAGSLVGSKLHIPIIHIESGLRSGDKRMPEEINRIMTDHVSEYLLCPTETAIENLTKEWIKKWVIRVQDPMYLTVNYFKEKALENDYIWSLWLTKDDYYFATTHRPSNTDDKKQLESIINLFNTLNKKVLIPIHPRTKKRIEEFNLKLSDNIVLIEPCGYLETLNYMFNSSAVLTDSGWLQKEAYILWKNIFTIRDRTEWIETVDSWRNKLLLDEKGILLENSNDLVENYRWWEYEEFYWEGESLDNLFSRILK